MRQLLFRKLIIICFTCLSTISATSQKLYTVFNPELMLSGATLQQNNRSIDFDPRFSGFFNVQNVGHSDWSPYFGFYTGVSIKNIGLIIDADSAQLKFRSYNIGIPIALKLGQLTKQRFLFVGVEPELAVHFKRKVFEGKSKTKESDWFSRETPRFMYHVFVGFQFNPFLGIKCRYYLNDFLNPNYTTNQSNIEIKPYQDMQSQLFTFSLYWVIEDPKRKYDITPKKLDSNTQKTYLLDF